MHRLQTDQRTTDRDVDHGFGFIAQRERLEVADDADDLERLLVDLDDLADRAPGKELPGEGAIHPRDRPALICVGPLGETPFDERHTQCLEIACGDRGIHRERRKLVR
jgi:hypothetical protein